MKLKLLCAVILAGLFVVACDRTGGDVQPSKSSAGLSESANVSSSKASSGGADADSPSTQPRAPETIEKVVKSEAEWKKVLTADQYFILREHGTEPPFRNEFWDHHEKGMYICAGCDLILFSSADKFDSGTGWPSYTRMAAPGHVLISTDPDGSRNQLKCARCDGHLGHVFDDGPPPTGQRFCIDSGALKFVPSAK